jgi:hypothetical protein
MERSGGVAGAGLVWAASGRGAFGAAHGSGRRELRGETHALEQSLIAMNRELSLAREFIAAQARDLDRWAARAWSG